MWQQKTSVLSTLKWRQVTHIILSKSAFKVRIKNSLCKTLGYHFQVYFLSQIKVRRY